METKPCSWCTTHQSGLFVGPGRFRDFDSDTSYGIYVCGGCGGLGVQVLNEEFDSERKQIMELRFKFCPTDPSHIRMGQYPNVLMAMYLKELIDVVTSHYEKYKNVAHDDCYAKDIAEGGLNNGLALLQNRAEEQLQAVIQAKQHANAEAELCRPALVLAMNGEVEKADAMFIELCEKHPNNSYVFHDYGTFSISFLRDAHKASELFLKSCDMKPKLSLHYLQAGRVLLLLNNKKEALRVLRTASQSQDYEEYKNGIEEYICEVEERNMAIN